MHEIEIILGLLLVVAALAVVAEMLAVPYPILLVMGGLALGFIPGLPEVELDPELVFLLFLPLLLTSAAWNTSWRDFQFKLRPILLLAIGLVLVTNTGTPFLKRDLILFLTFCVILVTLVLQGLTLPILIRWLKVVGDDGTERKEMEGRLRAAEAAMARIEELAAQDDVPAEIEMVQWLRTQY